MKINIKFVIAAAIVIIAAGLIYSQLLNKRHSIKATFNCSQGKSIQAEFSQNKVKLLLSDKRNIQLPLAISASGARYANADESLVFWNKGDTALIEEKGQTTFTDCVESEDNQKSSQPEKLSSPPPARSEVHAGDGTMTLIRQVTTQAGQPLSYSFLVASLTSQDKNERVILTKTVDPGEEISIPGNSWSPDNKYIFLQTKDAAGQINFLVLKASGEPFANGESYLDVGAIFKEKKMNSTLVDATGWASPIFLNVTTQDDEAKKGPAYWFDVQTQNFWGHR